MSDFEVNALHNSDENTAVVKSDKTEESAESAGNPSVWYAEMQCDPDYKCFKTINHLIFVLYFLLAGFCFAPLGALIVGSPGGSQRVVIFLKTLSATGIIILGLSLIFAVFHCKHVGIKAENFEQKYLRSFSAQTPGEVRNRQILFEKRERNVFVVLTLIAAGAMIVFGFKNFKLAEAVCDYRDGIELIHQGEYIEATAKLGSTSCKEYRDSRGLIVYCLARDCYNNGSVVVAREKLDELNQEYKITNFQMANEIKKFEKKVDDEYNKYLKEKEEEEQTKAEPERKRPSTTEPAETTTQKKYSYRRPSYQKEDKGDYNPQDYYDPEDFYDDYYDDFADYEEAEDYYYDHED